MATTVFHIEGGIGKNVAATAVITAYKKAKPKRKIIVVSAWPEVWINNPHIARFYRIGNTPYFYQDVIIHENLSGRASLNMKLAADFNLEHGIIYPSIDSKINLEINDGVLKNSILMSDIAESIKESPAKLAMGRKNLQLLENRLNEISFSDTGLGSWFLARSAIAITAYLPLLVSFIIQIVKLLLKNMVYLY